MISPKFWLIMRITLAASLVSLLILIPSFFSRGITRAAANQPALQDTPDYSFPEDTAGPEDGYNGPGTPSAGGPTQSGPSTPVPSPTITLTPTLKPNVFLTENAEMGGSQVTAAPGTPAASITPYASPTATTTPVRSASSRTSANKKGGLSVDWGMFWFGFSLPVLAACGGVLYMLDRRPDFFKPKR